MVGVIGPEIVVFSVATTVLTLDFLLGQRRKVWLAYLSLLGLLGALAVTLLAPVEGSIFSGTFSSDALTLFFRLALVGLALAIVLASVGPLASERSQGEYYTLLLFSLCGAMILAGATELVTLYLGLELMALPAYALVAFRKTNEKANDAALKYFVLGLLSSAVIVYGMSLLYGLTGQTNLGEIARAVQTGAPPLVLASVLLLAGFAFKVAAVPFHFWAPDAYEGAPAPIAAYLAAISKLAAFAALLRIFLTALPGTADSWQAWFGVLAAVTMVAGTLMALPQSNLKRLLAYSSITHVGYALIGFAVGTALAFATMLFYLVVYAVGSIGAFFVISAASKGINEEAEDIVHHAGLWSRSPALAFSMTVFLLSLVGIPPLAGFIGKVYLFGAAIEAGGTVPVGLAVIAVLATVVSLGYYMKIIREMYMVEPQAPPIPKPSLGLRAAIYLTLIAVVALGIFNFPLLELATKAVGIFGAS